MKILIISRYSDFSGQVMDKLAREGHSMAGILYGMPEGGSKKRYPVYEYAASDGLCKKVIRAHTPELIIFLASVHISDGECDLSQEFSLFRDVLGSMSGQRVILQSDCLLFGLSEDEGRICDNARFLPAAGTQAILNEVLFQSVCARKGLPLTILRTGVIYGPDIRDSRIRRMLAGDPDALYVRAAPEDYWNLLYVTDALEALNRCVRANLTGIYNVCGFEWIRLDRLARLLSAKGAIVNFDKPKKGPPINPFPAGGGPQTDQAGLGANTQCVENTECYRKFKMATDWLPFVNIEAGFSSEAADYESGANIRPKKETLLRSLTKKLSKRLFLPAFTIIGFIIVTLLQMFLQNYALLRTMDLRAIYVVVTAARGGSVYGLIAAALAGVSFFADTYSYGVQPADLLYNPNNWVPFIIFILLGSTFGYWKRLQNDEYDELKNEIQTLKKKYADLETVYSDTLTIKNAIQEQIFNIEDSFGSVFQMIEYLNTEQSDQVVSLAVDVLERGLRVSRVAIYAITDVNGNAKLLASSHEFEDAAPVLELAGRPKLHSAAMAGKYYIDTELSGDICCAFPIITGGKADYLVTVHECTVDQFTLAFQNKFIIICGLIKNALLQSLRYEEVFRKRSGRGG